eukprot:scaffold16280_cov115-Skeletonema_dohrnii-CCMP3373.AAC.4
MIDEVRSPPQHEVAAVDKSDETHTPIICHATSPTTHHPKEKVHQLMMLYILIYYFCYLKVVHQ